VRNVVDQVAAHVRLLIGRSAAGRPALAAALLAAFAALALTVACGSTGGAAGTATTSASPSPTPNGLRVWLAGGRPISGGEGVILASQDGGAAPWEMQVSGAAGVLRDVWFADEAHGWAVGDANTIIATDDGGKSWTAQTAPGGFNALYGITFADRLHGWVVGGIEGHPPGTILATGDGGQTWRTQRSKGSDLYAVAFADEDTGWAVGAQGLVLATADGGGHWRTQRPASGQDGWLRDVTALDADHVWAVGETREMHGLVLSTADGGDHWTRRPSAPAGLWSVSFADADHGCVGGYDGGLFTTADGGVTWERHHIRYQRRDGTGSSYAIDEAFRAVSMTDSQHITVVTETGLVYSTDDGVTWIERHGHCRASSVSSAFFLAP
jgi:photosystem II stability/assembly factor-like uncharacterized protein